MPKSFRRRQSKDSQPRAISRALLDEAQLRHGFPLGHGSAQGGSSRFSSDFFAREGNERARVGCQSTCTKQAGNGQNGLRDIKELILIFPGMNAQAQVRRLESDACVTVKTRCTNTWNPNI